MELSSSAMAHKLQRLCLVVLCIAGIISARLIYLQVIKQYALFIQSQKNFLRVEKIASPRGNILDFHGSLLATNRPAHNLFWHGTGLRNLSTEQRTLLEQVGAITGNNFFADASHLRDLLYAERYRRDFLLVHDMSFDVLCKLQEQLVDTKNIRIKTVCKRHYPYQYLACHIIGYLGIIDIDISGKMGLEKICESDLRGTEGIRVRKINSFGTSLDEQEVDKGQSGKDIITTIDIDIQKIAEQVFPANQAGVMVAMDPQDGSIRALLSRPAFDPELFLRKISLDDWTVLQQSRPFINRAFNACYPLGSIFKIVTMSAALEHGLISRDATWFCPGFYMYADRKYGCHNHTGHGLISTCESLTQSCNIVFYEIGRRAPVDLIADYAKRFGLGEKTGIAFNEQVGIVPSRAWKMKEKKERWWPGETLSLAIGQSYLLVTPMQVTRMIGSIFTKKLTKPRILIEEPVVTQDLMIQQDTLNFIKKSMHDVVIHGTGRRIGYMPGFEIYLKTSTAQVSTLQKRDLGNEFLEHAWVATYFTYKDNPGLVLVMFMENVGASRVAVGHVRNFLLEYQKLMDDRQQQACRQY